MRKAVQVSCGDNYTLAVLSDGSVWAWGSNWNGELGIGEKGGIFATPVRVKGLEDIVMVSAGKDHNLALRRDGTVWAWGRNEGGQLGDGTRESKLVPVQVKGLKDVVMVAAAEGHSLALKRDGTIWVWGFNSDGVLGLNEIVTHCEVPLKVEGLGEIVSIATNRYLVFALRKDGRIVAWGKRWHKHLCGDIDLWDKRKFIIIDKLEDIVAIALGENHAVALRQDGRVLTWGVFEYDLWRENERIFPVLIERELLEDVRMIAAGYKHALVVKGDGSVWAWGMNRRGQLGDGTVVSKVFPVRVRGIEGVVSISGGGWHTVAVKEDGSIWGWGFNYFGQVGSRDGVVREEDYVITTPVEVFDKSFFC